MSFNFLRRIFFVSVVLLMCVCSSIAQPKQASMEQCFASKVWLPDLQDGRYRNPIIYADYSDPDVIRVGKEYYMTASSFNCTPGLPILHSRDMIHWTIIGHALPKQYPVEYFNVPRHGDGCWAPCIRYHNEHFYIYWGDPDFGIYMVKASNPAGPWTEPVLVLEGKGLIDPSPLWDDDGKVWLVHGWAGSRAGVNSLLTVNQLSPDGSKALDEGKHVFDGHDAHPTIEGPKFYKRDGYYYIFAPAGGVSTGWQLALRSKDVYGPYEEKIVLEQGGSETNGPHQGAWVETPEGKSWFYHFQDREAYGRIVHLQPMEWKDGWPVIGKDGDGDGIGEPVYYWEKPVKTNLETICTPAEDDEFNSDRLGLQWQWHANPMVTWYALMRGSGYLRLFPMKLPEDQINMWMSPNLLLQKFPAPDFTATTSISWNVDTIAMNGKRAGLLVMGNDYAGLVIYRDNEGYKISQIECLKAKSGASEKMLDEHRLPGNEVFMRVKVESPLGWCRFSWSTDGTHFYSIGKPFQAQPDTWIGAKVGVFSSSSDNKKRGGFADIDWFRITK